jgi:hypothetical protein
VNGAGGGIVEAALATLVAWAGASALDADGTVGSWTGGAVEAGVGTGAGAGGGGGAFLPQALNSKAAANAAVQTAPKRREDVMQAFMGTPLSSTWRVPTAGVADPSRLAASV